MSKIIRLNTSELEGNFNTAWPSNTLFVGPNNELRIGDGSTQGGILLTGGAAAGSNTQVQFNDNGALAGHQNFTFNTGTDTLQVPDNIIVNNIFSVDSTIVHVHDDLETFGAFTAQGVYLADGGSLINLGDGTVDLNSTGTVKIEAADVSLTFTTDGTITIPGVIRSSTGSYYLAQSDASTEMSWQAAVINTSSNVYSGIGTDASTGVWIETATTDELGGWLTKGWTFGFNSILTLPNTAELRPNGTGIDLRAGTAGYAQLQNSNASRVIGVNDSLSYIQTYDKTWNFDADGVLTAPGNLIPGVDNAYDLGRNGKQWNGLYANSATIDTGGLTVWGPVTFNGPFNYTGTATVTVANSATFFGDIYGFGALYAGVASYTTTINTIIQSSANVNDYAQNNFQNSDNGATASSDWVATSPDGTDTINYIDMGIVSGTWDGTQLNSLYTALGPNDGYLYVQGGTGGGNLVVGASSTGMSVKILAGQPDTQGIVATFTATGLILNTGTITFTDQTVQNTAWTGTVAWSSIAGAPDVTGYTGSAGSIGDIGYTGSAGSIGDIGYTGSAGSIGDIGYTGSAGSNGTNGYTGSVGFTGSLGYTGSFGYYGSFGYFGSLGYTGSTGPVTSATSSVLGGVKIGAGLVTQGDGTISVSTSSLINGSYSASLASAGTFTVTTDILSTTGMFRTTSSTSYIVNSTPTQVFIAGGATIGTTIGNAAGTVTINGDLQAATNGFTIGYRDIPQLSLTTSTTLALTDAGKHYYTTTSTSNITVTIPANTVTNFSIGAAINIVNQGTSTITIAQGNGVTLYLAGNSTSGNRSLGSYGIATLQKVAANTWFAVGVGLS